MTVAGTPGSSDDARVDLVVPVKGTAAAKSRLDPVAHRESLARAFALDTLTAVRSARRVARVVVVTAATDLALVLPSSSAAGQAGSAARPADVEVVIEARPAGLRAAISLGLARLDLARPRAVLLGDLPALHPDELDAALELAARHPRAFVADAAGTGTSLVTAAAGIHLRPLFGADSAQAHRSAGFVQLDVPATSGLRRDVDTPADLDALADAPLGPATRAALQAAALPSAAPRVE